MGIAPGVEEQSLGVTPAHFATHTGSLCTRPRANPPPWGAVPFIQLQTGLGAGVWVLGSLLVWDNTAWRATAWLKHTESKTANSSMDTLFFLPQAHADGL